MKLHKAFPMLCMQHLEWDGRFLRCTECGEILAFVYDGGDHLSVAVFEPHVRRVKAMLRREEPGYIDAAVYSRCYPEEQRAVIDERDYPLLVGSLQELSEDIRNAVHGRRKRKGITVKIGKSEDV